MDYRTILRAGRPFHYPTNLAASPKGTVRQRRLRQRGVHKFSPTAGCFSLGENRETALVSFMLPHGIAVDRQGTVYVADRENSRIQLYGRWPIPGRMDGRGPALPGLHR